MSENVARETALSAIQESLSPLIGENLARSSVKLHTEKLGLDGAQLSRDQLVSLLQQIGLGLRVFVGAERTDALTDQILSTLFREGA